VDRPDPTSGGGQGGRHLALGRAVIIIVVAVVLGVLILRSGGPSSVALPTPTSSTTSSSTTTTAPPRSAPRSDVKVLVVNDSTTSGVAGDYTTVLQHAGWSVLVPGNAKPPPVATSSVYYASNKRSDADAVATALGLPLSDVLPLSPATPVSNVAGADVVLVVGADLAAKTPPSTVPPTTTTTAVKHTTTTTKAKSH
jgi:hypothetical protein